MLPETKQVDTAHADTRYTPHSSAETKVGYFRPSEEQAARPDETVSLPGLFSELRALVAECAYQFYENRGRQDGHDLDDWLEAERQIVAQFGQSS